MKKILSFALLAAVMLAGCDKGGKEETPEYKVTMANSPYATVGVKTADDTKSYAEISATEGETLTVEAANIDENYTFTGWTVVKGGVTLLPDAKTNPATFKMPAREVEIKAEFAERQVMLPAPSEAEKTAYADEQEKTVTFTAKSDWTASVAGATRADDAEIPETRASGVSWLRLTMGGEETYGGKAGTFDLTIELDINATGSDRSAIITITSGGTTVTIEVTQKGKTESGEVPEDPGKPEEPGDVAVTGVTISPEGDVNVMPGGSVQLTATVLPDSATNKSVTWSVSGSATVDVTGNVTVAANATAGGTVTVTATSDADPAIKATKTITVGTPGEPEQPGENPFTYGGATHEITGGTMYYYGDLYETGSSENVWLELYSSDGTGMDISMLVPKGTDRLVAGMYTGEGSRAPGTFTNDEPDSSVLVDAAADRWVNITGGTVNVSVEGATYTVEVDCTLADGSSVTGTYTGALSWVDETEEDPDTVVAVTGITIAPEGDVNVVPGGSVQLSATVQPSNATDKRVIWMIGPGMAAIDATGKVTVGNSTQSYTVTVTAMSYADHSIKAEKTITVGTAEDPETVAVTGVTLNKSTISLTPGGSETLTATVAPANATYKNVLWSSSDPAVATVDDNGTVRAANVTATGMAVITAMTEEGHKTATCTVTVSAGETSIYITSSSQTTFTLTPPYVPAPGQFGELKTQNVYVFASNAPSGSTMTLTCESSNTAVFTVTDYSNGCRIDPVGGGTATLTATATINGKTYTADCTVTVNVIDATSVSIEDSILKSFHFTSGSVYYPGYTANLAIDDSFILGFEITPGNASYDEVTWSSSNPSVASVTAGRVTTSNMGAFNSRQVCEVKGLATGTAVITVTTREGHTDSRTVTVFDPWVPGR